MRQNCAELWMCADDTTYTIVQKKPINYGIFFINNDDNNQNILTEISKKCQLNQNEEEWIILDYSDIVVHIFKTEKRDFYGIEDLWGDAEATTYKSA